MHVDISSYATEEALLMEFKDRDLWHTYQNL